MSFDATEGGLDGTTWQDYAIMHCIMHGDAKTMKFLLSRGLDPNSARGNPSKNFATIYPVWEASYQKGETLETLLEHGGENYKSIPYELFLKKRIKSEDVRVAVKLIDSLKVPLKELVKEIALSEEVLNIIKDRQQKNRNLWKVSGQLVDDPVIKTNANGNGKKYLLAKLENKRGKIVTILTYTKDGIAALKDKHKGDKTDLWGTFSQSGPRTFSAMGLFEDIPKKPLKEKSQSKKTSPKDEQLTM